MPRRKPATPKAEPTKDEATTPAVEQPLDNPLVPVDKRP